MVIQRMMFDNRIGFSFSQSNFILIRTFRSLTAGKSKCTKLTKYGESLRSRWLASRNIFGTRNTRNSRNLRVASPSLSAVPSVCIPEVKHKCNVCASVYFVYFVCDKKHSVREKQCHQCDLLTKNNQRDRKRV